MPFDKEDVPDLTNKYVGSFIRVSPKGENKWIVICIETISQNDDVLCISGKSRSDGFQAYDERFHDFDFSFPIMGVHQHGAGVIVCSRYPVRKFRRAMTQENTFVYNPVQQLITPEVRRKYVIPKDSILSKEYKFNFAEVESLFNNNYLSLKEAILKIKNQKLSAAAVSKNYFIIPSLKKSNSFTLFRREFMVAEFDEDLQYTCYSAPFEQEVIDFFKRSI